MIDFSETELQLLITHQVGNAAREDGIKLSADYSAITEDSMGHLLDYFIGSFKQEEFFQFSHAVELKLNPVYALVQEIFEDRERFIEHSQSLAKLLYEHSTHPMVKSGEFHLAYFSQIAAQGQAIDAIGLFKSEHKIPYLKMHEDEQAYIIDHDYGTEIKKLDKGCLIFNADAESGYKVLAVDVINRSQDAQYWKQDFLKLSSCQDEYHQTKSVMNMTKEFVTHYLPEEQAMERTDQIDLLNRTASYFKENEAFDKEEFVQEVFQQPQMIDSFHSFNQGYRQDYDLVIEDQFDISKSAVKKQSKIFKSVLKLDKNFHVYIHGNRELIERGVESDGRKFYKIYYDEER